ncbi:hypothetical protein N7520_003055 [Penicillium odoratum]|uniref:uncharacterized protein n=1 Tax=Penicillium odoratum TaxID=1167516 RepID=UPI002549C04A|nr:uncharacterized protein N7520_003055 [Penicillium odoratum]KAJ5772526.1 hypothetical protein N7520_003055 [Penicillium odoratum]
MLASLLRPRARRGQIDQSQFSSPFNGTDNSAWFGARRAPRQTRGADSSDDDEPELEDIDEDMDGHWENDDGEDDGPMESTPLLPIFSSSHLDALPVYDITHAIRTLIASRCETTLTWDQLRSPQVSQFLIKPIQQQIMSEHFSRATLYALMANCLQFEKEIQVNPGNSGASQTRAMVSELLAIKLLREYTTRELIDALSYDYYPLQGQDAPAWTNGPRGKVTGTTRISCLEVAIRAQAKRFLAHPVVVQQLEAIWAGTIVFHSAADHLHRPLNRRDQNYGTTTHQDGIPIPTENTPFRRSVTLYNPRNASLFKLSRLRVPRYRQFLSTISFAVLLGLFLAVLESRSGRITSLEIVFWFWSAGFMLDEIVGFNEQGFSLYLMSFWNIFDLGILLLLFCYYCLRVYGAFLTYPRSNQMADQAYDILAASSVLLFPRLFSILDHYRYFSQLLVAFRIMAADLIAVFVLIVIACSGFFVAFLSFGNNNSPKSVAYGLFQLVMGFTPTAWAMWDEYNFLGRAILTIFLFICHFVIVTILVSVLSNSFMRIVNNANSEHQFLFAVNTISMVKSDALFSYVAPTNIIAWLVTPFRYLLPFRQYIKLNRTIIKVTHLPILFTICLYEKTILSARVMEPTDLVDTTSQKPLVQTRPSRFQAFSTRAHRLMREPSIATYHKDQALEEVFRQHTDDNRDREGPDSMRKRQTNNVIKDWMQEVGSGPAHTPDEQDPAIVNQLEMPFRRPRFPVRKEMANPERNFTETTRSLAASNPEDRAPPTFYPQRRDSNSPTRTRQLSQHTDMEGDDELETDDGLEEHSEKGSASDGANPIGSAGKSTPRFYSSRPSTARVISRRGSPVRRPGHRRNMSGATILYNPVESPNEETEGHTTPPRTHEDSSDDDHLLGISSSANVGTVRRHAFNSIPSRNPSLGFNHMSVPEIEGLYMTDRQALRRPQRSLMFDLGSDLGDNRAVAGGLTGVVPSSFNTQMAFATGDLRGHGRSQSHEMLSKLVLARINNLEGGLREVMEEVKKVGRNESSGSLIPEKKKREQKDTKRRKTQSDGSGQGRGRDRQRSTEDDARRSG